MNTLITLVTILSFGAIAAVSNLMTRGQIQIPDIAPTATPPKISTPASHLVDPQPPVTQTPLTIRPIALPTNVRGGQTFDIRWVVEGPPNLIVSQTSVEVVFEQNNGGTTVHSRSQQSFGSTMTGEEHSSTFSFDSGPGTITVTLRAGAGDKEVTRLDTIAVR